MPHQNATTLQVAISVTAACMWVIEHPDRGVQLPDDLPHDYVLGIANPYLGKFISVASDWTPLKHYSTPSTATIVLRSIPPTPGSSRTSC